MANEYIESCVCGYKYVKEDKEWLNRSIASGTEPFLRIQLVHASFNIDGGNCEDMVACPKCKTVKLTSVYNACGPF